MNRLLFLFLMLVQPTVWALEFSSQAQASRVVELYTSEGCSSCPPADRWLSGLKKNKDLFKTIVPMAFHVDYWDQLGWPGRFAAEAYSNRQRALAREGLISQVYTPGIVVNSQEWRGWFNGRRDLPENNTQPGVLHVSLDGNTLNVNFAQDRRLILNFALLGMGLETQVKAGENHGKKLKHDFVVLSHWQQQGTKQWQIKMPEQEDHGQQRTVLAVWLNSPDSLKIIQAAASYID